MATLELRRIAKSYGKAAKIHVLKDIDLDVADGAFVVLVGPSGCGKSTLLRLVAGLDDATSGDILLDGRRVNDVDAAKRDIAMVFQSYALYPHMTNADNMAFHMRIAGVAKPERDRRIAHAAEILGIGHLLNRTPRELSGGQRQRVAMGRAIVREPKVYLFDEPLSNLDAQLRMELRTEIKALHQRLGTTTVYVTHDQIEAMTLADRIVVMHDGIIEQIGSPLEVFDHPANVFVARFIGSPPMNLLQATIAENNGGLCAAVGDLALPLPQARAEWVGRPIILGIRPAAFSLSHDPRDIEGVIDVLEMTGQETMLHVSAGQQRLHVCLPGRHPFSPGDRVSLRADSQHLHLFDAASSIRLM
jgi:multiple sugar transport system ATP-binding protein